MMKPLCCSKEKDDLILSLELFCSGVVFGLFNNLSTIFNIKTLHERDYGLAAWLSLFFLLFPGIVTSFGFLVFHFLGHKKVGKLPPVSVIIYFFVLLFFYPVLTVAMSIYTLVTGKRKELPILAKYLEGFLDDGPQFVLRLILFVLFGLGREGLDKDNIIFTLSMATSFCALVYCGMQFNERDTNGFVKWLVSFPMFLTSLAARGFTLAVFLKETTITTIGDSDEAGAENDDTVSHEWIGGVCVIAAYCFFNVIAFYISGQDLIRSVVFGFSSTLIPAGYNNDEYFYQCPNQPLWSDDPTQTQYENRDPDNNTIGPSSLNNAQLGENHNSNSRQRYYEEIQIPEIGSAPMNNISKEEEANAKTINPLNNMKSGKFLIIHTVLSTLILSGCAIYISITKENLSDSSTNALILPQILAVVPGCFFTLSRSVLYLKNNKPRIFPQKAWDIILIMFSAILSIIAYGSVIPALFWSLLWKVSGAAVDLVQEIEDMG